MDLRRVSLYCKISLACAAALWGGSFRARCDSQSVSLLAKSRLVASPHDLAQNDCYYWLNTDAFLVFRRTHSKKRQIFRWSLSTKNVDHLDVLSHTFRFTVGILLLLMFLQMVHGCYGRATSIGILFHPLEARSSYPGNYRPVEVGNYCGWTIAAIGS